MKKNLFLFILSIPLLFSSNLLFSGNSSTKNKKLNFIEKRFARELDISKLCKDYFPQAFKIYKKAIQESKDVESTNFENQELFQIVKNIRFHLQINKWYDSKLAQLILKVYFKENDNISQKQLDRSLCTAAYIGDIESVRTLLSLGANYNFVNKQHYSYTPLVYTLLQEHHFSKISKKSDDIKQLITNYEDIAKMLIDTGANIKGKIRNGLSNDPSIKTYIFMQTCNLKIFSLFEDQIIDEIETVDNIGRNIVIYAFMFGDISFIAQLYSNSLFKDSVIARTDEKGNPRTFMDLALQYYKRSDFKELYEFLIDNAEKPTRGEYSSEEFGLLCLNNAMDELDFECIRSLYLEGISLNGIYQSDNSTYLINCIKNVTDTTPLKSLIQIIELFCEAGIDFSHEDKHAKTALDHAIKKKLHHRVIQALICTPVIYAIKGSLTDNQIIKLINSAKEQNGEVREYRDSHNKTALDYADGSKFNGWILDALDS